MSLRATTLLVALAFSAAALAGPKGNVANGKKKAVAVCAACHGADGNKTLDASYPKLGGQYPEYLAKALHEYKSGKRKNPIMAGQAQGLSEQEIADLSAYYGSQASHIHDLSGHAR
jgi:cytochrome c553